MKKLLVLMLGMLLAGGLNAGSSGSCGSKVTCKSGDKAKCQMINGSSTVFMQASFLDLLEPTELFLTDVYSYKINNTGTIDCYYTRTKNPEDWMIFKTIPYHNVIPRDNSEWISRHDTLYCDPEIHSCLLYILY